LCKNSEGDPAKPDLAATTYWRSAPDATLSSRFSFAGLAFLMAEYNKRNCPTSLGNKPSRHRGQRYASSLPTLILAIFLFRLFGQGMMTNIALTSMARWLVT
jgi:hypothetical protein